MWIGLLPLLLEGHLQLQDHPNKQLIIKIQISKWDLIISRFRVGFLGGLDHVENPGSGYLNLVSVEQSQLKPWQLTSLESWLQVQINIKLLGLLNDFQYRYQ